MRVPMSIVLIALTIIPAAAEETLFAEPAPGQLNNVETHSLGDIMMLKQLRHIKLWYAGRSRNWALVNFELRQIEKALADAAMRYQNIPTDYIVAGGKPLHMMEEAARAQDQKKFVQGFDDLTAACNSCHQAGQVGFIKIRQPTSSPFSNQIFEPAR